MTKPLYAYKKYNGFLGIAGVYNGELLLATKSTVDKNSDHVKLFREVFDELSDTERTIEEFVRTIQLFICI